ncbi:MAG: fatty acid desaturase [Lentisphaerae bacterium]|nr:fatty acid desaturase [Lentisphaerota bacterium]
MKLDFTPRAELADYEWNNQTGRWRRPELDRETIKELSQRSTLNGLLRIGLLVLFLAASAAATIAVSRINVWLAIPLLYVYYFFYGFWVPIGHELQHKVVFARSADWFSESLYFFVQTILWNSPRYARISHRLHHRYTMVRGVDPETDWPEVFTSKWVRQFLFSFIRGILVVGSIQELGKAVMMQIRRILGQRDRMMRDHCSEKDIRTIRIESAAILLIHLAVVAAALYFRRWEPIALVTIAWQMGWSIEGLWHQTEHVGRLYNVDEQRLCTRSIAVNPLVRMLYWGLDDHVDHHMFPSIPSRNLPKLHKILKRDLAEPRGMIDCWREMFAIAREKDQHPDSEYVPIQV